MRQFLFLLFFLLSLQAVTAQENPNPLISVDNAQSLTPLYTINESFSVGVFSQFEEDGTTVLLIDSEYDEETRNTISTITTLNWVTQSVTNTFTFNSHGPIGYPRQIPGQSKLVFLSMGGGIYILDYSHNEVLQELYSSSSYYTSSEISADGSTLVYTDCEYLADGSGCTPDSWSIQIYNLITLEYQNTIYPELSDIGQLALSNDGHILAVQAKTGEIIVYDTFTNEKLAVRGEVCPAYYTTQNLIFLDEETILAIQPPCFGSSQASVWLWNFVTGEERTVFSSEYDRILATGLVNDNSILAALATDARLYLLDFETGEILNEIETSIYDSTFDFSPDGRYLLLGNTIYGIEN